MDVGNNEEELLASSKGGKATTEDVAMPEKADRRVPVTILTGFLGSGKTTLLNHILTATHGKKIAIIENEFGAVAIDDALIAKQSKFASDEEIIEVLNGCVCCSVRQDLQAILVKLANKTKAGELALDAIVIETTGMANPGPVAQTFLLDLRIRAFARLDGVVTLVDAKHIEQHLDEEKPEGVMNEAAMQVGFADRLLLNKIDVVEEEDLTRIEARLRAMNKFAPIQRCQQANVSVDSVLDIHGFDLDRKLTSDPDFLNPDAPLAGHDQSITSVSLDQSAARHLCKVRKGELDLELTQAWLNELLVKQGNDIFRMKGLLAIEHEERRFIYHAVHMLFEGFFEEAIAGGGEGARVCKLVFIGKGLDEQALADRFNACLATPENLARKASIPHVVKDGPWILPWESVHCQAPPYYRELFETRQRVTLMVDVEKLKWLRLNVPFGADMHAKRGTSDYTLLDRRSALPPQLAAVPGAAELWAEFRDALLKLLQQASPSMFNQMFTKWREHVVPTLMPKLQELNDGGEWAARWLACGQIRLTYFDRTGEYRRKLQTKDTLVLGNAHFVMFGFTLEVPRASQQGDAEAELCMPCASLASGPVDVHNRAY